MEDNSSAALVDASIKGGQLPGVEEWRPPKDFGNKDSKVVFHRDTPFRGLLERHFQPTTTVTVEVERKPDFEVKIWKASNGFMIEVCGEKYVAKNAKEMADLFLRAFNEK